MLLVLAVAGVVQGQPALAPTPTPIPADGEMVRVATWMTGTFDTFEQVAADEAAKADYVHMRVVMHIVPARIAGLSSRDTVTLYVEQAAAETPDQPYRQRVYHVMRREGALVNRTYRLAEPAAFVGAHARPEILAKLTADRLSLEDGCDLVWTRIDDHLYSGIAGLNGTCRTSWRGATLATSQVLLTPGRITSLDQGFDDAGVQRWGPKPGTIGHVFRKRPAGPFVAH